MFTRSVFDLSLDELKALFDSLSSLSSSTNMCVALKVHHPKNDTQLIIFKVFVSQLIGNFNLKLPFDN